MFEEACRPVLFEQDDSDYPYWGKGSSVIVANTKYYYWVTSAHVINNMGGSSDSVRIFPTDNSRVSIPFNQLYRIEAEEDISEDYKDLYVLRIDLEEFAKNGDMPLTAQDIEYGAFPPAKLNTGDRLMVICYPSESRAVDYEEYKIKYKREPLSAEYIGKSRYAEHCHTLRFSESVQLDDYDGISGSPVFYMNEVMHECRSVFFPLLVGLIIRGGSNSRQAHFISVDVLVNLIQKAESNSA